MLLEAVEDDGLRAIKESADSAEETRGKRQGQTMCGLAVIRKTFCSKPCFIRGQPLSILGISLNSRSHLGHISQWLHQQTPSHSAAAISSISFILLSGGAHGELDMA